MKYVQEIRKEFLKFLKSIYMVSEQFIGATIIFTNRKQFIAKITFICKIFMHFIFQIKTSDKHVKVISFIEYPLLLSYVHPSVV